MNVTFIVESYYPSTGGVQGVTKYLAEGLAKKGYDVTVITTKKEYKNREVINGVNIVRFDLKKTKSKKYYGEVEKYVNYVLNRNDDYTIFECTENITTDLMLPYLKQINGKKILHIHGCYGLTIKPFVIKGRIFKTLGNTYNYFFWNFYYYPYILSKYVNDFDAVISLSEIDSGNKFFDKYFKGKRFILGNAAEDMFFNKTENGKYEFGNKNYFLSVANYRTIKNQISILRQFRKANCKDKYKLFFIGTHKNEYYEKLKRMREKYGLTNSVQILTGIERKELPQIMKNAYAYLVGSTYEEFSISIIEAMISGIPFISTNVGNARLLPGGITINNINDMANKMDLLVQEKDLYNKLSYEAKEYAKENCRIDICVDKLEKILKEV